MAKLWQKQYTLDSLIEEFTVGRDFELDEELVVADCVGSIAHARMLKSIGILTGDECVRLAQELVLIVREAENHAFHIRRDEEDCHTAIENRLTEKVGEPGKKIHTGRSRNDQIVTVLRLHARAFLIQFVSAAIRLASTLADFAGKYRTTPMPGRTHMQAGMPSSVGLWAGAYAEELMGQLTLSPSLYDLVDQCPLGSAASYGVPLPLDRELVAELLGFSRVQNNVLYANNAQGTTDAWILTLVEHIGLTLSRFAQDLILFSLPELGYFTLPVELCSGSSIMPQKINPDGLELLRAKSSTLSHYAGQVRDIARCLPSGYNRDIQETKEPYLRATRLSVLCLEVCDLTVSKLKVNEKRLRDAFTPEIFAADAALDLVSKGASFREAYRTVGAKLDDLDAGDPEKALQKRTATGTPGNLNLAGIEQQISMISEHIVERQDRMESALKRLVGFLPKIY